jgi:hypothetical protein
MAYSLGRRSHMKILGSLGLSLVISVATLAGVSAQAPAAPPAVTSSPGVFASTDAGVVPLSAYYSGVATTLPVGFQSNTITVPRAKTFKSFIVNVKDWTPANVKLYFLNGITEVWAGGQSPLKAETKTHTGGFEISSPETAGRTNGFVILEVKPGGTGTTKYYAVNMGKEFTLGGKAAK